MTKLREALLPKKWFRFLYLDERDQAVSDIEKGLRAAVDAMEEVYMEIYHDGSAIDEGVKFACVTAGVTAMMEGS